MGISAGFMVPHPPLIIPDVGRGEEKKIQKTIGAYKKAAEAVGRLQPETIVLLSPHQTMYADYFHISPGKGARGDFGQFRAGQASMEVSYDTEFVRALCEAAIDSDLQAGTLGEREKKLDHGTMVPLYFVNQYWTEYRLVRVGLSGLPLAAHYRLGQCIQTVSQTLGRNTVVIASGDLSHKLKEEGPYGYQEEGPIYDARIMDVMGRGDFGKLFQFWKISARRRQSADIVPLPLWRAHLTGPVWRQSSFPMKDLSGWGMASVPIDPAAMTIHGIFWSSMRRRSGRRVLRGGNGKTLTSGWRGTLSRSL